MLGRRRPWRRSARDRRPGWWQCAAPSGRGCAVGPRRRGGRSRGSPRPDGSAADPLGRRGAGPSLQSHPVTAPSDLLGFPENPSWPGRDLLGWTPEHYRGRTFSWPVGSSGIIWGCPGLCRVCRSARSCRGTAPSPPPSTRRACATSARCWRPVPAGYACWTGCTCPRGRAAGAELDVPLLEALAGSADPRRRPARGAAGRAAPRRPAGAPAGRPLPADQSAAGPARGTARRPRPHAGRAPERDGRPAGGGPAAAPARPAAAGGRRVPGRRPGPRAAAPAARPARPAPRGHHRPGAGGRAGRAAERLRAAEDALRAGRRAEERGDREAASAGYLWALHAACDDRRGAGRTGPRARPHPDPGHRTARGPRRGALAGQPGAARRVAAAAVVPGRPGQGRGPHRPRLRRGHRGPGTGHRGRAGHPRSGTRPCRCATGGWTVRHWCPGGCSSPPTCPAWC